MTRDSVTVEVYECFDADSVLDGYKAYVYTPICEDEECYAVELYYYWDLLGNFQKYELIPEKPLTKREHEPFTEEDYNRLQNLLEKKETAFSGLKKEELVKQVKDTVDGYTGATIAAIKDEVIPGAVYSCYTLWNAAHGTVIDSIHVHTEKHIDFSLVQKMIHLEDIEAFYYLINHFEVEDFNFFQNEILLMIQKGKGYFAKNAIEALPNDLIYSKGFQDSLAISYSGMEYFAQLSLIKRLKDQLKSSILSSAIIDDLSQPNSQRIQAVIDVFDLSEKYLTVDTYKKLLHAIAENDIRLDKNQLKRISKLNPDDIRFRKEFKRFKQLTNSAKS